MSESRARRAFTLAEVVVALVLLAWGCLALAAAGAAAVRTVATSEAHDFATAAATDRLEQLAAGPCSGLSSGTALDTARQVSERWTAGAEQNGVRLLTVRVEYSDRGALSAALHRRLVLC